MKMIIQLTTVLLATLMLTGCPVMDRDLDKRYAPADISTITLTGDDVCMAVPYPSDYQLRMISINPRGTDPKTWWYKAEPDLKLTINQGQICIPPSFYTFEPHRQYVIRTVMWSDKKYQQTQYGGRAVIAAFEIEDGHAWRVILEEREQ